jgi:hypothetical protein
MFRVEQKAGSALKKSNGWMNAQSNGTNKSGYNALPGGERMFYGEPFGEFVGIG